MNSVSQYNSTRLAKFLHDLNRAFKVAKVINPILEQQINTINSKLDYKVQDIVESNLKIIAILENTSNILLDNINIVKEFLKDRFPNPIISIIEIDPEVLLKELKQLKNKSYTEYY